MSGHRAIAIIVAAASLGIFIGLENPGVRRQRQAEAACISDHRSAYECYAIIHGGR